MMSTPVIKALVVEDDQDDFFIIQTMLSKLKGVGGSSSYSAERIGTYAEAMEVLKGDKHQVCLLDYRLPGGNGLDFLREAKDQGISTPIIFLTGIADDAVDEEAMKLGASDFLRKNKIDAELLGRSIRYAMERTKNEKTVSQLAAIVESSEDAIYLVDLAGVIQSWNKGAEKIYGYAAGEMAGKSISVIMPEEPKGTFLGLLKYLNQDQTVVTGETRHLRKDGTLVDVSVTLTPLAGHFKTITQASVIARDITERKRQEEMIRKHEERQRQSEKLEAIGNLAAGVAHDFNNLLNVINGNADLLMMDNPGEEAKEELGDIKKAVYRGSEMTRQLLLFSRKDVSQPTLVDLNRIVEEVSKMLRRMIQENVEIVLKNAPELKAIKADSLHIQQILMNLAVNARDAMPEGGKLMIETKNMDLDEAFEGRRAEIPPGRYVMLSVSDTGTGMDKEVQERIFEPFFTTKEPGKGTGLGLATVYGVVQKYGGYIWVYSEKGMGTTFRICFRAEAYAETEGPRGEQAPPPGGGETLLVVEDEPSLRRVLVRTLERAGYKVVEAEDGEKGLARMQEFSKEVKMLVTDTVMPKMSGKKLADEVRKTQKDLKVLFMSGYPRDVLSTQGVLDPSIQLLQKPFSGEMLLRRVRDILDGRVQEAQAE